MDSLERLRVSADSRRLETSSGRPFFYLADTAWTMPQRLKWDDARHFMSVRKSQGFNVLQIVALDPERDVKMRNPAGETALFDDDLTKPNERYFAYLDEILDSAEQLGFYVLLLPVWGQLVVGESWGGKTFPKTVTVENAAWFGEWIGRRYRERTNIIWCLGGDRQPIHAGVDYRMVWRELAEGLAFGVTGRRAKWHQESEIWDQLLITYHTCFEMETGEYSTFSYWTDEDKWISFTSLQSGHGLLTENYKAVTLEQQRKTIRPVIDIEPAYERMPMNWPELFPLHGDGIVRKRAYWSVLAGACGHSYGHASVWCFISEKERDQVLDASWFEALSHPGAAQLGFLRQLATTVPFERWLPDQSLTDHVCQQPCLDEHIQSARDRNGEFVIAYLSSGGQVDLKLDALSSAPLVGIWFNPRTGNTETFDVTDQRITLSSPTSGLDQDWILLVANRSLELGGLGERNSWGEPEEIGRMTMIWAE